MTRRGKGEEGSSLVLALIFLTVIGLVIAAIMSFTSTSFLVAETIRDERDLAYAADAAVEHAIATLESSDDCPDPVTVNGQTVTIDCEVASASGSGDNDANTPPKAVLTLATGSEDGIVQSSNALTGIDGDIFSNSTIVNSASSAELEVDGWVDAIGNCTGTITSTKGNLRCANQPGGAANAADGADPGIASPTTWAPETSNFDDLSLRDSAYLGAKCAAAGTSVTLDPGYYDDASALSALTSTCGKTSILFPSNGNSVGIYYFDFRDTGTISCGTADSRAHLWCIDDPNLVIVGGTPWTGFPSSTPGLGSRCEKDEPGVQFLFGNDSHVKVANGSVELCAHPNTDRQQIALYGVQTSDPVDPPTVTPETTETLTAGTVTASEFTSSDSAKTIDGTYATAPSSTSSPAEKATLTLSNFSPTIGEGTVSKVLVRIKHQQSGSVKSLKLTVTRGGTGKSSESYDAVACTSGSSTFCFSSGASAHTDEIDVTSFYSDKTDGSRFTGMTVTLEATGNKAKGAVQPWQELVDGIEVVVTYDPPDPAYDADPPRFREQSGCITTVPYESDGACALAETEGTKANLVVHGTTYAVDAALDVQITNAATQIFDRGVIVRALRLAVTPSTTCLDTPEGCPATVQIPVLGSGTGTRTALVTACITDADSTDAACGSGQRAKVRALVEYPPTGPVVKRWATVR